METVSVSELTKGIKLLIESGFDLIRVKGEISNFTAHSSGHKYFTLKDESAQISCVMWKSRKLDFMPKNGDKIIIEGYLDVYPPQGKYQIDCARIEKAGKGDLYLAFEELKKKLGEKGYFDESRKKAIPYFSKSIGVATSPTGAAVKDILTTLKRRNPTAIIYFRPTLVQGDGAGADVANAINELNQTDAEILIIGRGGGSIEDLWAFNEEIVANAIFNSEKPIISAVGHETDFTISDFVADLRAATPTAAAELASQITLDDLKANLNDLAERCKSSINFAVKTKKDLSESILSRKIEKRIFDRINIFKQEVDTFDSRLSVLVKRAIDSKSKELIALERHISSLQPLAPLDKGFALILKDGKLIDNNNAINIDDRIEIQRKYQTIEALITNLKN